MKSACRGLLFFVLAFIFVNATLAASDTLIKGVVTDSAGKPVRGALVTATAGYKAVTRYTQKDGRYEIAVPAGKYEISAQSFGYVAKRETKDISQPDETNFTLSAKWDVTRLSGGELEQLVPNDAPGRLLKTTCEGCHDFSTVLHRRGQTTEEWRNFLPTMTNNRRDQPDWSPARLDALSAALGKYFGPDSPYMGPDAAPPTREQVNHPEISDAALKSTITEWTTPTGFDAFPHSIEIDSQRGIAWFSEVGNRGLDTKVCAQFTIATPNPPGATCGDNHIGRFDIKTETFHEYPVPHPHTGSIGKDGRVWYAEAMRNTTSPHLAVIDPQTSEIKFYRNEGHKSHGHTPATDQQGNIWLSVSDENAVWRFDVEKLQFQTFKFPIPEKYPEYSVGAWQEIPGENKHTLPHSERVGTYHVAFDSKGGAWASVLELGMLVRIDPETGATKEYFPPNVSGERGIMVDQHDNVWFGAFFDHKVGKLDPKTGTFKLYQPPTPGSTIYGIVEDKKTGYVWFADETGNNITRLDPKTEQFVEYPLPLHPSIPRFIDVASDGKVWFTEYWNGKIGNIDTGDTGKTNASR